MTEQMKKLLDQESHALAELSDRIDRAVAHIIEIGWNSINKDNIAFVSDGALTQFNIDPYHDFMVMDTIIERLAERPEIFSFDVKENGYRIEFNPPEIQNSITEQDVLGPARKAELFDELLKTYEGLLDDDSTYKIFRGIMTEQEIIKSGFQFEQNEAEPEVRLILDQLGGQAGIGIPSHPSKLRDLLSIQLPCATYLDHCSAAMDLISIGGLDPEDITSNKLSGWGDVLDADILQIYPGAYGVHIKVDNVDPDRLSDFAYRASMDDLAEPQEDHVLIEY